MTKIHTRQLTTIHTRQSKIQLAQKVNNTKVRNYCFVWIWAIISLYSINWLVFITETECDYCAIRSKFYCPPTECIYVFCVDLRTNSFYFTVQHWLVDFYNRDGVCLLRGTFYILRFAHTVCLCVLCGSENKQRLFHCTALTGWFL